MITLSHVTHTYGSHRAVDQVTLDVPDGSVTALVGPTGSGKTSVLAIAAGLVRPDSGRVLVDGVPFSEVSRPGTTVGVHLPEAWLPAELTLESHLRHVCSLQGLRRGRADDLLAAVGLHGARHRRIKDCTPAMRQRLGVASALSGDPHHLLLDHPTRGLDADSAAWVRAVARSIATRGGAVLLAADRVADVVAVADTVVTLERGRVSRTGGVTEFVEPRGRTYVESDHLELVLAALVERGYETERHGTGAVVQAAPGDVGRVAFDHAPGLTHLSTLPPQETKQDA